MARGRVLSFTPRRLPFSRLETAFRLVRRFTAKVLPRLARVRLEKDCGEIIQFRMDHPGKTGHRNVMHVGHVPGAVCSLKMVDKLPAEYIFGLLLHEFGHLGVDAGGDSGEREADGWILDTFDIRIHYKGALDLEWVDPGVVEWIATGKP